MPLWPFTRAKLAGYVDNVDVPSAAELNKIDTQQAQAADGLLYPDVPLATNWLYQSSALTNRGICVVWTGDRWLSIGMNSTTPECSRSRDGKTWTSIGSMGAGGVSLTNLNVAAATGTGKVVVGGFPSGATAQKIRESSDHGATWTVRSMVNSGAQGVLALVWFPRANLFVAQLTNGNIETSPDGITWTARTLPGAAAPSGRSLAVSPTAIVVLVGSAGVARSTDGITWTTETISTGGARADTIVYSPGLQKFFTFDESGGTGAGFVITVSSDDGLTFADPGGLVQVVSLRSVVAYGRMLVAIQAGDGTAAHPRQLQYSIDGAVSWKVGTELPNTINAGPADIALSSASNRAQFMFVDDSLIHYASIALGG